MNKEAQEKLDTLLSPFVPEWGERIYLIDYIECWMDEEGYRKAPTGEELRLKIVQCGYGDMTIADLLAWVRKEFG